MGSAATGRRSASLCRHQRARVGKKTKWRDTGVSNQRGCDMFGSDTTAQGGNGAAGSTGDLVRVPAIGLFQAVDGSVTITRGNIAIAQPVVGDLVYEADLIETGSDGAASIAFVDGTTVSLYANSRIALDEFVYGEGDQSSHSAVLRVANGRFGFFAGKVATRGRLIVDTPVARIRSAASSAGIGSFAFGVLTFCLLEKLKAASSNIGLLDDGTIDYKDLKHGVFVIHTKEAHPRDIYVDDPSETVILRIVGTTLSVDQVPNSPTQMAQYQNAYQATYGTYLAGQQVIQQLQGNPNDHANAQPQSAPGSIGSSTALNILNNSGQVETENGGPPVGTSVSNISSTVGTTGGVPTGTLASNSPLPIALPSTTSSAPATSSAPTTVDWIAPTSGTWQSAPNWNINSVPGPQDIVHINQPVTVTINQPEAIGGGLVIGSNAVLKIATGGTLMLENSISNAGTIVLGDPILSVNGTSILSGGGVVNMLPQPPVI